MQFYSSVLNVLTSEICNCEAPMFRTCVEPLCFFVEEDDSILIISKIFYLHNYQGVFEFYIYKKLIFPDKLFVFNDSQEVYRLAMLPEANS